MLLLKPKLPELLLLDPLLKPKPLLPDEPDPLLLYVPPLDEPVRVWAKSMPLAARTTTPVRANDRNCLS